MSKARTQGYAASSELITSHTFECLVYVPLLPGAGRMALEAARGGGVGVLDAASLPQKPGGEAKVWALLSRQMRWLADRLHAGERVGVRCSEKQARVWDEWLRAEDLGLELVWVLEQVPGVTVSLAEGGTLLVEARSVEEAERAEALAVDGVIACGSEAGGVVGVDATFILTQKLLSSLRVPVYARGGVGQHSAAACRAGGCRGVVLDDAVLLTSESPLPAVWKQQLKTLMGHETAVLACLHSPGVAEEPAVSVRVLDRPLLQAVTRLKEAVRESCAKWNDAVETYVGWGAPEECAWPVGQGMASAKSLAERWGTVRAVVAAVLRGSRTAVATAEMLQPLARGSALAVSHGTEFPLVQGPMTRVSDHPAFTRAVAEAGALPFFAMAMLSPEQARPLLEETSELLGERPWGVGLLGFNPPELRDGQMREILRVKPKFALIAGGRADLAASLEKEGITAYLHAPAPALLRQFLEQGIKRFVWEGRECGGHVGPLNSFPLWDSMVDTMLECVPKGKETEFHVLFAGGLHDGLSSAMVSAFAAPLAERGIRCGGLMGTAYLFTQEAVDTGAVVKRYQEVAIACRTTVLLTSALGHSNRVADTAFAQEFEQRRRQLQTAGDAPEFVREELDGMMLGRLRVASKGLSRDDDGEWRPTTEDQQSLFGMYMLGDAATLRSERCTLLKLHEEVAAGAARVLRAAADLDRSDEDGVAIIGMGMLLPGAHGVETFWGNLLGKVDATREVPLDRWDIDAVFSRQKGEKDKVISKWGGFVEAIPFDPLRYRIPPAVMPAIATTQLLALEVSRWALEDAGYAEREFDRERTAVILGTSGGGSHLYEQLSARAMLPQTFEAGESVTSASESFPEWSGETFPGVLGNVVAGRISNLFDLGGPNFVVDAACASSLLATDAARRELLGGASRFALTGGVDTTQTPFTYAAFNSAQALSPRGQARVFDKNADGIVTSEGVCILVLKPMREAERDGDRVYAVIRGAGASSDGRGMGLTVPRVSGQRRAVQRALREAEIDVSTVTLFEAHGTGTLLGDRTELETLDSVLREAGVPARSRFVGSAKSLLGHTKCAAGAVGIAKAALALYHRALPPHAGLEQPQDTLADAGSPLATLGEARPWLPVAGHRRRAGVSAFGFGGTDGHMVLEEAPGASLAPVGAALWPVELFLVSGTEAAVLTRLEAMQAALASGSRPQMRALAQALAEVFRGDAAVRVAMVAATVTELEGLLSEAMRSVREKRAGSSAALAVVRAEEARQGRVALLFPGQGSQYPQMAREAALYFDPVRQVLEDAELFWQERTGESLGDVIFPPMAYTPEQQEEQKRALAYTHRAQTAIGAVSAGLLDLLTQIGVDADMVAGHSYGELTALYAAGALSRRTFLEASELRGRLMAQARAGGMVSVRATREAVEAALEGVEGVSLANHNGPLQTVVSGTQEGLAELLEKLKAAGTAAVRLPVSGAFHSPLMAEAVGPWTEFLAGAQIRETEVPLYSNLSGEAGGGPEEIRERLGQHLLSPVEFDRQIRSMARDGARVFIETGPNAVGTRLVSQILEPEQALLVSLDPQGGALRGLLSAVGLLCAHGVAKHPAGLFEGRGIGRQSVEQVLQEGMPVKHPVTTWWVDGTRSRSTMEATVPVKAVLGAVSTPTVMGNVPQQGVLLVLAATALPVASGGGAALAAYSAYQQTMRQFLALEEQALSTFLGMAGESAPVGAVPAPVVAQAVAAAPVPVPVVPEPTRQDVLGVVPDLTEVVVGAISQLTGYPQDVIGLDMDLTAELGIDSLRRMEILAAVAKALPGKAELTSGDDLLRAPSVRVIVQLLGAAGPEVVTATSVVKVTAAVTPKAALSSEGLLAKLTEIVSEASGYPAESLGADMDFEAELGIDSIRRIQIVERLLAVLDGAWRDGSADAAREQVLAARTMRRMAQALEQMSGAVVEPAKGSVAVGAANASVEPEGEDDCVRCVPEVSLQSLKGALVATLGRGPVLVTEDALGVAVEVCAELDRRGIAYLLLPQATLVDAARLRTFCEGVQGPLAGLLHLAPLGLRGVPAEGVAWKREVQVGAKALLQILNLCGEAFVAAGAPARMVVASGMGGSFGRGGFAVGASPLAGAGAGALRSFVLETVDAVARAVDFGPAMSAGEMAVALCAELLAEGPRMLEVGYGAAGRGVFVHRAAPIAVTRKRAEVVPAADWVVLATGGTRGITPEVLGALAVPGIRLVLLGRTAATQKGLAPATAAQLRGQMLSEARAAGQRAVPVEIEARVQERLREYERQQVLQRLRAAGARVETLACDVRDAKALGKVVREVYERYGRVDAVIHGAGVIEDKLVGDKEWASFDRVFDTKVESLHALVQGIDWSRLKLAVLFGSVAGRVGNRGQVDYAAANEVLNRFAWWLRVEHPEVRVSCINWGPWASVGMAGEGAQEQLKAREIFPISTLAGRRFFHEEVTRGAKEQVEVLAGQGPWVEAAVVNEAVVAERELVS